jgi:hypothetical protein
MAGRDFAARNIAAVFTADFDGDGTFDLMAQDAVRIVP